MTEAVAVRLGSLHLPELKEYVRCKSCNQQRALTNLAEEALGLPCAPGFADRLAVFLRAVLGVLGGVCSDGDCARKMAIATVAEAVLAWGLERLAVPPEAVTDALAAVTDALAAALRDAPPGAIAVTSPLFGGCLADAWATVWANCPTDADAAAVLANMDARHAQSWYITHVRDLELARSPLALCADVHGPRVLPPVGAVARLLAEEDDGASYTGVRLPPATMAQRCAQVEHAGNVALVLVGCTAHLATAVAADARCSALVWNRVQRTLDATAAPAKLARYATTLAKAGVPFPPNDADGAAAIAWFLGRAGNHVAVREFFGKCFPEAHLPADDRALLAKLGFLV